MYEIKPHPVIGHVITSLTLFGMWHRDDESVYLAIAKKVIYTIILVAFFASLGTGAFLAEDMNESISLSAAAVCTALMVVKLFYVLSKQKEVQEFLNDICVHSVTDVEEFDEITVQLNNFGKFGYANVCSMFVSIFLIIALSLAFFPSEKQLPLNIGFPLDWKRSVWEYWVAHTFVIISLVTAMVVTFFTIIYWNIMYNCSIKYKILGNKFRRFGSDSMNTEKNMLSTVEKRRLIVADLINLIKTHRRIQEYNFRVVIEFTEVKLII